MRTFVFALMSLLALFLLVGCTQPAVVTPQDLNSQNQNTLVSTPEQVVLKAIEVLNGLKSFQVDSTTVSILPGANPMTDTIFNVKLISVDLTNSKAHFVNILSKKDNNLPVTNIEEIFVIAKDQYTKNSVNPNKSGVVSSWIKSNSNLVLNSFIASTVNDLKTFKLGAVVDGNAGSTNAFVLNLTKVDGNNVVRETFYVSKANFVPLKILTEVKTNKGIMISKSESILKNVNSDLNIILPSVALKN